MSKQTLNNFDLLALQTLSKGKGDIAILARAILKLSQPKGRVLEELKSLIRQEQLSLLRRLLKEKRRGFWAKEIAA